MLRKLLFMCSCKPEDAIIKIDGARMYTECRSCLKKSPGIELAPRHRYNPSYYRDEWTWVRPKQVNGREMDMEVCHG